jgi:hypothetical protein
MHIKFWLERDKSEGLGVDGEGKMKMDFMDMGCDVENWIHLAQDRNRWRALGNTVP